MCLHVNHIATWSEQMATFIVDKVTGVVKLHKDHCEHAKKASTLPQFTDKDFSITAINHIMDKPWAILPCKTCCP